MNPLLRQIKRQLLADRKKLSMLMGLLAVGLLLWGRLLMQDVPRTAVAVPKLAASGPARPDNAGSTETFSGLRVVETVLVSRTERDPFSLQPQFFQTIPQAEEKPPSPEKSGPNPSDELERKEAAVREAARELQLQSTLLGAKPRAVINGVLIEIGQAIAGFELTEISSRHVKLKKDGVVVELEM